MQVIQPNIVIWSNVWIFLFSHTQDQNHSSAVSDAHIFWVSYVCNDPGFKRNLS